GRGPLAGRRGAAARDGRPARATAAGGDRGPDPGRPLRQRGPHTRRQGGGPVQDLIRLLPDGASAVPVLIVVLLFLKQQARINAMLESTTQGFNDQVGHSQKAFQDQIVRLNRQQYDNQKLYQDQIQSLIDAHIKVSRETILALKSLEASLKDARERG